MTRIDGKIIAEKILQDLKHRVKQLKKRGVAPHLVVILVGHDPASALYVKRKKLQGELIGAKATIKELPTNTSVQKLLSIIEELNNNNNVHGIIVQRPLPPTINNSIIAKAVLPEKDIDGLHPKSQFEMPLARAVLRILRKIGEFKSKRIVVIGKGQTGGGPVIKRLKELGVKTIVIDSKTTNPQLITRTADIIISAVGRANIVTGEMIKKGVILISVGMHRESDDKFHGDYEEEKISGIAGFYTPTPGGVGPVNVACLLENLIKAAENQ